jgi:fructokinase
VFVAGDALLDITRTENLEEKSVGGGAVNTARVLGNLEIPTWFVGCLSDDESGELIKDSLKQSGVHLDYVHKSKLPTATASLSFDKDGNASYDFDFKAKATFEFGDWLPKVQPKILHVGSLSSVLEPGASTLFSWASNLKSEIIYDPNIRPMIFHDKEGYRKSFIKWASISKIVKLSEDDLKWLDFEVDSILEFGVEIVVLTLGEKGIRASSSSFEVEVAAVPVDVVDTVGAGDTVGAVIAETMYLGSPLNSENLKISLEKAAIAASITCGKKGAEPVSRNELP